MPTPSLAQSTGPSTFRYCKCPNCMTVFAISGSQLQAGDGQVRCGNCFKVFYANNCFILGPYNPFKPEASETVLLCKPQQPAENTPPRALSQAQDIRPTPIASPSASLSRAEKKRQEKERKALHWLNHVAPSTQKKQSTKRTQHRHSHRPLLLSLLTCAALAISLPTTLLPIAQTQWATQWPKLQHQICQIITCPSSEMALTDDLNLLDKRLVTHPIYQDKLRFYAQLHNEAKLPQHYPTIEIRLTNAQQQVLSTQVFRPEDYLSLELHTKRNSLLSGNQILHLALDLDDPGREATGYQLAFVQPSASMQKNGHEIPL